MKIAERAKLRSLLNDRAQALRDQRTSSADWLRQDLATKINAVLREKEIHQSSISASTAGNTAEPKSLINTLFSKINNGVILLGALVVVLAYFGYSSSTDVWQHVQQAISPKPPVVPVAVPNPVSSPTTVIVGGSHSVSGGVGTSSDSVYTEAGALNHTNGGGNDSVSAVPAVKKHHRKAHKTADTTAPAVIVNQP